MNFGKRHAHLPTVQEMRALTAVADLGSASAAAQSLNLTQSAISRAIRSLEDRLGVRLFHRERQRLVLSDVGRAMLRDTNDILDRLDASARMAMAFRGAENVLRIAALPTFARTWLIPRLPGLMRDRPDIRLDIAPALGPVDFRNSRFDAAIQRSEMAGLGTNVIPLCKERLIVVAAPCLIGTEKVSLRSLLSFPMIQQSTRPSLWAEWLDSAGLETFYQTPGPRFEHFDMILDAAAAGLGLALVPDIFANAELGSGRLVQLSSETLSGRAPYALIYPSSSSHKSLGAFSSWLEGHVE